jgi:hypothetical protein
MKMAMAARSGNRRMKAGRGAGSLAVESALS